MRAHKIYLNKIGDPYILSTALGLILSLSMVIWMIYIILIKGLGLFWASDLIEVKLKTGEKYLGELREYSTSISLDPSGKQLEKKEIQLKIGNRDLYGRDFVWILESDISQKVKPEFATTFERWDYGNFYGNLQKLQVGDKIVEENAIVIYEEAKQALDEVHYNKERIEELENELNELITPLSRIQREISLLEISSEVKTSTGMQKLETLRNKALELEKDITEEYVRISEQLQQYKNLNRNIYLEVQTADGNIQNIGLESVVRFYQPNRMNSFSKSLLYVSRLFEFVSADPRESNTEGGIFPAIFGTVLMVLLMSIVVVPFGVLAAIYLNEYAKQGTVIRLIRLSVNNLAGVPSIVFGIFGLGFFIYMVGGTIDQLFFSHKLPEPTFGTGGILWASLTLALLTVPVVVVATEEGILAVPRANKEGALALGATRWQMIRKIVLPNAMPGILTGLILAISRGAGEVAPLMITGVVKLAPSLAVDGSFPFLHLDRKFMHLGFHIYDVGFQSPNVEAAKSMVYTTALLLIFLVVILNLLAIYLRNRLRKKYKSAAF
jgi:phosphate transport system permease protein